MHTGQHYDRELSQVFFEELSLAEPKHALGLRTSDPDAMRVPIARIVEAERPGWCSSTATRTRRSPAPAPPLKRPCRSPTSRPACAAAICPCPRSGIGSRSTGSRSCSSRRTSA